MDKEKEIPIEEQMLRRQSAPRPTAQSEAIKFKKITEFPRVDPLSGIPQGASPAMDGFFNEKSFSIAPDIRSNAVKYLFNRSLFSGVCT